MTIELTVTLIFALLFVTMPAAASLFFCGVQIEIEKDGVRVRIEPRRRR